MEQHELVKKIWYKCQHCAYQRIGDTILDFEDMVLLKDCVTCGGFWKFKCPQCGMANKTRKMEMTK